LANYDTISVGDVPQDLTSWTVSHGSLVWGLNVSDINVRSGHGFVDLTGLGDNANHGTISQTMPTILGQSYAFSIYTTLYLGLGGITVDDNGHAIALAGSNGNWNGSPTGATWGQLTGSFIADGTSTTINIAGVPGFSFMIGLDDVSVTGPAIGTVPEASTWTMLLLGFAGIGSVAYRRKSSSAFRVARSAHSSPA
jgi:hypothetical protein